MSEAFISYSRLDGAFADKLLQDLEKRGIDVWIDRENIEGGAAWRAAISGAIRSCRAFILILSPRSTQSGQVSKELSVAEAHNRLIVPVMLEACEIPPGMELQLSELQWISFAEQPYDAALERLTRVVTEAGSRTAGTATPDGQGSAERASPAIARPAAPRVSSSNDSPPSGSSGNGRKWLLASVVAIVVVAASFAAFRYMQEPSNTASENAARAATRTADGAALPAVTAPTNSQTRIAPAVATGSPDTTPLAVARADSAPTRASPRVIGNSRTSLYHLPSCPGFQNVRDEFRTEFSSVQEAEKAGYRRADNCPGPAAAPAAVIANNRTHYYHLPHCPGYSATREEYRVTFQSAAEAEQAGYRRAEKCTQ